MLLNPFKGHCPSSFSASVIIDKPILDRINTSSKAICSKSQDTETMISPSLQYLEQDFCACRAQLHYYLKVAAAALIYEIYAVTRCVSKAQVIRSNCLNSVQYKEYPQAGDRLSGPNSGIHSLIQRITRVDVTTIAMAVPWW